MLEVLLALNCMAFIALAWVLFHKYRRTRDSGFLWLGVALLVWPLLAALLGYGEGELFKRLTAGQSVGFYPFSLVEQGQITLGTLMAMFSYLHQFIGYVLVLLGIINLYKNPPRDATVRP